MPTLGQLYWNIISQRWRNVELATVSLRWPNGQTYVSPTSPIYVGPTVLLALGQRSCAIWVSLLCCLINMCWFHEYWHNVDNAIIGERASGTCLPKSKINLIMSMLRIS